MTGPGNDATAKLTDLTNQLTQLRTVQETSIGGLSENTRAVQQNTVTKSTGSGSVLGSIASAAGSFLTQGLGLSPLITGLIGLFGGGNKTQTAPISSSFRLPASVSFEGAIGGGTSLTQPVDYGQNGQPRTAAPAQAPMVNIQVSAMDSRSFLDHSEDIARAVREAILHSSSLNDVISDL